MALQKLNVPINFQMGLDQKTDPYQVPVGKFLGLDNMVFDKVGRLQKRNGYPALTSLPDTSNTFITTFNGNLTAIGTSIYALSAGSQSWVNKGNIQPLKLSTLPLIRSNTNQSQCDSSVSSNGLMCVVYTDNVPVSGSNVPQYKYAVVDSTTGQNIINPTIIPSGGIVQNSPRVFLLRNYFVIVYGSNFTGTNHLQFIAINSLVPTQITAPANISTQFTPSSTVAFDGYVFNNNLYIAWNGSDLGGSIRVSYIDSTLTLHATVIMAGHKATLMSVTADLTSNSGVIWVTFWDSSSNNGYTMAFNQILASVLAPTQIITGIVIRNLTSVCENMLMTALYETIHAYSYDSTIDTDFISSITCTQSGTVGSPNIVVRSLGIASKAFIVNDVIYLLGAYNSGFQPSYFLINISGQVISQLAYSNGGGYLNTGLPSVSVYNNVASISYLIKDLIESVNKTQGIANAAGIYSQTGVNQVSFTIGTSDIITSEIGNNINFTGGFLWNYDGYKAVENNFFLWPDYVESSNSTTGGALKSQVYFYQVTYEWADNAGNVNRSAPSIPLEVDLSKNAPTPITFTSTFTAGDKTITVSSVAGLKVGQFITDNTTPTNIEGGTYITAINGSVLTLNLPVVANSGSPDTLQTVDTNSITLNIPTLRLTYKIANPVKIVIYRWSTAQQNYYQVTSTITPLLNDTTVDSVSFLDTLPDQSILGNNLIYTTGGVIENISAPSFNSLTLWNTRLIGIDAEDPNLLWFSKQVIENVPVEMSDLFTYFIAPTTGSQGSTGPMRCIAPMDDKLIIFKDNALEYINGVGPDNTGANNQFSQPYLITSTVGCNNQKSIVFMPNGLMFQSNKGIWLLGRDLSTTYIGAPVETYTLGNTVQSAVNVPGTNQVRFTLNTGITLMYDYYVGQWGTFSNVAAISSTIYQDLHTYLNEFGQVYQEQPGTYLDGSKPVLISFTTSWLNMTGLQGYQRVYYFYLLGTFLTPHSLNVSMAYDYNSAVTQVVMIQPNNYSLPYGGDSPYGNPLAVGFGGNGNIEQWRVDLEQQQCQAIQITINEIFNPFFGTISGAGLTLSGLNFIIGAKSRYPRLAAINTAG